jgi:CubicO group peptidase (beta-lactamase class C family)
MTRTRATFLTAVLYGLLAVGLAQAQSLPAARPEQVGLSSERLGQLTAILRADADKGVIPGAILLVARQGKVAWFETVGVRDPATRAPMTRDAIFRIYSMTKPITSLAVMMLVEDGKLALGDPDTKCWPSATPSPSTSRSSAVSRWAWRSRMRVVSRRSSSSPPGER